ncbi:MAG: M20/M25/M40 family metallo-hydrolase [Propionibacteriaceae bacterium]
MIRKRAAGQAERSQQPTGRGLWSVVAGLLVLVVAGLSAWSTLPGPVPETVAAEDFSAHRAMDQLERVASEPRVPGEPAHREARELLVAEFDRLGWQTEVHESIGMNTAGSTTVPMASVGNVIATLPGTDPSGTVLLAAHYDTVPGSPGGADDGIGMAVALEAARALSEDGERPRNDVVVLLTDAEEPGLLGAEAFTEERAADLGHAVVVNLEARGNRGMPISVRLTQPNSVLFDLLSETPEPLVDSFSDALFAVLDNNTDMARFAEAGLYGFDTAITGGGAYYHTLLDDADHLSTESLQQMGEGSLAFARAAAAEDLARIPAGSREIGVSHPGGLVSFPEGLELPMAAAALLLALAATVVARVRRTVTAPRMVLATLVALVLPVLAALLPVGLWQVALAVDPGQASAYVGDPYVLWPYAVSCLAGVLVLVTGVRALLRRGLPGPTFVLGGLLGLAVLGLLLATVVPALPGLATPIVLPVLPAALAALVALIMPVGWTAVRRAILTAGALPAAVLISPALVGTFEVGMATGAPLAGLFATVLALIALVPIDAAGTRGGDLGRRLRTPLVLLLVALLGAGAGLVLNREGATDPRQEMVTYSLDADNAEAVWSSWSPSGSDWSQELMGDPVDSLDHLPWLGGGDLANGPAPATAGLDGPTVDVVTDREVDGRRVLELDLSSQRGASSVGMWFDAEAGLRAATVQGRDVPVSRLSEGQPGDFGFLLRGTESEPVRVRLEMEATGTPVRMQVADLTHDPTAVEGFEPPDGRILVTPNVYVHRTIEV